MRGAVFIAPVASVPSGQMVDPGTAQFWASWQDEEARCTIEDADFDGAEAAIAWARERSERVSIRLGHTQGTYFSAGSIRPDGAGAMPAWPPKSAPPGGWWAPPGPPTLAEAQAVASEVERGERTAGSAAAWAWERRPVAAECEQETQAVLVELTKGWFYENHEARPVSEISRSS